MTENHKDYLLKKLEKFKEGDILFSVHAGEKAALRGIARNEIIKRLLNPSELVYAEPDEGSGKGEKFKCYFDVSKRFYHLYIIAISKDEVEVITVFSSNKRKQRRVAKYSKIPPF